MRQLLFIHGGEAWGDRAQLLSAMRGWTADDPFESAESPKRWKHWLADELGQEWRCAYPSMPNKLDARYDEWALWLEKQLPYVQDGIVLVGHSLGANFLAKWLTEYVFPKRIAQLHLVSGCYDCPGGFDLPEPLAGIEQQCAEIHLWHAHDDPVVPFADAERYARALPSARTHWLDERGHFLGGTFPELLKIIASA